MGWTTTRINPRETRQQMAIGEIFGPDVPIIRAETVNTTLYVAYRDSDGDVRAAVVLCEYEGNEVSYKAMGEDEGPVEAKASRAFLASLTATDNSYALAWRERCWLAGWEV